MSSTNLPSLFSITADLIQVEQQISAQHGEVDVLQESFLKSLLALSEDKVTSYCNLLDHLENKIKLVEGQIDHANEYISGISKTKAKLLEIAGSSASARGLHKLEGSMGRAITSRRSESVAVNCKPEDLPIHLVRQTTKVEADKLAIKEALKSGLEIPGCEIVERVSWNWK